jgi:uncharacterized protein YndB with AHSA1/START domain
MTTQTKITVQVRIHKDQKTVWESLTLPEHITHWNNASDDWHSPRAVNDLRPQGSFNIRMEAKDGSVGFDFEGTYTDVLPMRYYRYEMSDGRVVEVTLYDHGDFTEVIEEFDPENENPLEMQRFGWQSILDNLKKYTESLKEE